jgi:hypothetical protein
MRFCQRHFVGALLSATFYRRNFALRYFVGQPVSLVGKLHLASEYS